MTLRDKNYWAKVREDLLAYSRYWGTRIIPPKIIPGLTFQGMIQLQEAYAGVPMTHPEFIKRSLEKDKELERKVEERLKALHD